MSDQSQKGLESCQGQLEFMGLLLTFSEESKRPGRAVVLFQKKQYSRLKTRY